MAERFFYFVVVLIFMFNGESFGQLTSVEKTYLFDTRTYFTQCKYESELKQNNVKLRTNKSVCPGGRSHFFTNMYLTGNVQTAERIPLLNKKFYIQSLGFFCRKELQFEKITSVPMRIRLGSLEYTNYLEQKPNAIKPN